MFSRLRDFITRHRRKLIVTGVVVGSTFIAIKYAQRKLSEFQERQARDFLDKSRRMMHFESTERTCNQVILGMGAELSQAVIRECSTDELLEQIRTNPSNKVQLWEEMKIVAFTRLSALIYASSMLVVALRVQLNLLGGYLYHDTTKGGHSQISDGLRQQYLSLIRYFIYDGGLSELVRLIRSKVMAVMREMPLTKRLSLADLEQLFWSLQMAINSDANRDPCSKLCKYLLPDNLLGFDAESESPLLQKMFNETLDLLESDDASSVCSHNICRGFSLAVDAMAESIGETVALSRSFQRNAAKANQTKGGDEASAVKASTTTESAAVEETQAGTGTTSVTETATSAGSTVEPTAFQNDVIFNSDGNLLNINSVQVALAKIIPIVSGLTSKGFDSNRRPQNLATSLITFYVVSEKAKILGANVYETFSSTPSLSPSQPLSPSSSS